MARRTLTFTDILSPSSLASNIANKWTQWNNDRGPWRQEKKELRNYIFQTSTRDTTNAQLPWKNSTATPKLCQIRDNLHANYMAALFPNENWLNWQGDNEDAELEEKRLAIQDYMRNKAEQSGFRATISQLVYDWIDYGNAFATTEWVVDTDRDALGNEQVRYIGPRLVRVSPFDIVFNPLSPTFEDSPKVLRSLKSIGDIEKDLLLLPEMGYEEGALDGIKDRRRKIAELDLSDVDKSDGFIVDGFGSVMEYFDSGMVEFLDFYGSLYDAETGEFFNNYVITVVDRTTVIRMEPIPEWNKAVFRHVGWRLRPDNLYAMGPLDNLVGMQYRIDHLENLKADVFDLIAHPVAVIRGYVEDFEYGPGARIVVGDDGAVTWDRPPDTVLNADTQIAILEQKMEDFAGAPKQAMGIRTPGEKTKFEVQTLENALGRIFQNKTSYFEENFEEKLLNDMLEQARRNLDTEDVVRTMSDDIDVVIFRSVTRGDLIANGRLKPIGARHFATKANMLQNLVQISNSVLVQDEAVKVHMSGKKIAKAIEMLLEVEKFGLVEDNIRISEMHETQTLMQAAQENALVEQSTPSGSTLDEELAGG